jgi:hypothetical protein
MRLSALAEFRAIKHGFDSIRLLKNCSYPKHPRYTVNVPYLVQLDNAVHETPPEVQIVRSLQLSFHRKLDVEVSGPEDVYDVVRQIELFAERARLATTLNMILTAAHMQVLLVVSPSSEQAFEVAHRITQVVEDIDRYCSDPASPVFGLHVVRNTEFRTCGLSDA